MSAGRSAAVDDAVRAAVRDEWSRVVASVMRTARDLQLAEDAAQDAVAEALEQWPVSGIPDRPGAWLTTVARRRATDRVRRSQTGERKHELAARLDEPRGSPTPDEMEEDMFDDDTIRDDELRLVFLCCHPALAPESQVALTLRSVAGLTTTEIAHAYLVEEATMAQRLVRAKKKVKLAGIPFKVPDDELLGERVHAVLTVVYLIFNEGYSSSTGDELLRTDLCEEAIRLGRLLRTLLPDDPEVRGLLALMLFAHARRDVRVGADGALVLMEDQDRTRWRADEITEGLELLDHGRLITIRSGPYVLQAAIAAEHARAGDVESTDWRAIVSLYDLLLARTGSSVVALNRAVAVAMADGPIEGLALVDALVEAGELSNYHLLHAARADLLRRVGLLDDAREAYQRALALTGNSAEQEFLQDRLDGI